MYNYQQHKRQQNLTGQFRSTYQGFLRESEHRKELTQTLYSHHKKRIDAFIISAIQQPICIQQYKPPKYNPRQLSSSLRSSMMKHDKSFRMNSHTSTERIEEIFRQNSFLDPVPFNNSSLHRFRQSQQKQRPMKYTDSSTPMRLIENLMKSRMNQVNLFQRDMNSRGRNKSIYKLSKFYKLNMKTSKESIMNKQKENSVNQITNLPPAKGLNDLSIMNIQSKQIGKLLTPSLHRKAYFNSMKSILVDNYKSLNKESIEKQKQVNQNKHQFDIDKDYKKNLKNKKKINENVNRLENAAIALNKCGLVKMKSNFHKL